MEAATFPVNAWPSSALLGKCGLDPQTHARLLVDLKLGVYEIWNPFWVSLSSFLEAGY